MKPSVFEPLKPLSVPVYAVAILLVTIPLADTALAMLPVRAGDASWRFGALGIGSQAIMTPMLGLLLLLGAAVGLGHRRVVQTVRILAWLAAVVLAGALVLFVLDAVEVRATLTAQAKPALDKASLLALGKYVVGAGVSVLFAVACGRLAGAMRPAAADAEKTPLMFGTRAES